MVFRDDHLGLFKRYGFEPKLIIKGRKCDRTQAFGQGRVERVCQQLGMDPSMTRFYHVHNLMGEMKRMAKVQEIKAEIVLPPQLTQQIPSRIRTGIKNQTINVPSNEGFFDPAKYPFFRLQQQQHDVLAEILARFHLKLDFLGVDKIPCVESGIPQAGRVNTSFVAWAGYVNDNTAPLFVWQKYCGTSTASSTNNVFVAGKKFTTSTFVAKAGDEQFMDELFEPILLKCWVTQ